MGLPLSDRIAFAARPVLVVALAKTALNLSVASRYGWHRDELYYAAAGRHLAGGYIDFPPVTPLLAMIGRGIYGDSLVGLRAFAALAGAGVVFLSALVARELGGGQAGADRGCGRGRLLADPARRERVVPARLVRPADDDVRALPCAAPGPFALATALAAPWDRGRHRGGDEVHSCTGRRNPARVVRCPSTG